MIKAKRKKPVKFCALCRCPNHKDMGPADGGNWDCPLLGEKICSTDCEIELEGGMGAPDILKEVCERTNKTPQEVHAVCVACPHGGKKLEKAPKLVSALVDGEGPKSSGPEFERAKKEYKAKWEKKIGWLQGKNK